VLLICFSYQLLWAWLARPSGWFLCFGAMKAWLDLGGGHGGIKLHHGSHRSPTGRSEVNSKEQ